MPKKLTRRADVAATSDQYQLKLMGIFPTYICSEKEIKTLKKNYNSIFCFS